MKSIRKRISGVVSKTLETMMGRILRILKYDRSSILEIGSFDGFEVAYRKGTADEDVIAHSFNRCGFFSEVPEYRPADNHVVMDVGAHIGTFSLLASSKVPRGKVYAIEVSEDSYNFLRINIALNRAANISAHHLAIADREGTCKLYYATKNLGHSVVSRRSVHSKTVNCCTLAGFLERNGIDRCHFMKMNCEGGEFPILLSTPSDVLQRFDVIVVLYHCDLYSGNTEADLLSHFQSSGFNSTVRNRSKNRGWVIAANTSRP